jgi:hypothetical protein
MLIPTTPGRLDRVLARITTTRPTSASRVLRGPLLATLLAIAAVARTGALDTPRADAAQPPPGPRTYKVTADLDGRLSPINRPGAIVAVDFLLKGQRVPIECQKYGDRAYGSRLWDLVTSRRRTLFVPDRFIKTHTSGRAPEIRPCSGQDQPDTIPH